MDFIRVSEADQLRLLQELLHLRTQRTHLQAANTKLELENRDLRVLLHRFDEPACLTPRELRRFAAASGEQKDELLSDELRRSTLWMRLRGVFGEAQ
jgi:regulator of replication initiation timing